MNEILNKAGKLAEAVRGLVGGVNLHGKNIHPASLKYLSSHIEYIQKILGEYDKSVIDNFEKEEEEVK